MADLAHMLASYRQRIFKNNSRSLIRLASVVPLAGISATHNPAQRSRRTVRFSFFDELCEVTEPRLTSRWRPKASISSSLNDFGYDTLTVNGRFEASTDGFARMTKNFAVGSLNASGFGLRPSMVANAEIVVLLLGKLRAFLRGWRVRGSRNAADVQGGRRPRRCLDLGGPFRHQAAIRWRS